MPNRGGSLFTVDDSSQGFYRHLFEVGVDPLLLTDRDGTIREANARARALLGGARPIAGTPLMDYVAEHSQIALQRLLQQASGSDQACARLSLRDSPETVLEAHVCSVVGSDGVLLQWALRDISIRVKAERLQYDLIDLLLHDLRSPLATTSLGLQTAERGLQRKDLAQARHALSLVSSVLRRLMRLVDSLLDISHLETGRLALRLTEVDVAELLTEAAAEVRPLAAVHELDVKLDLAPGLPIAVADRDMLFRVVINLLDNAIKFSPPKSWVWLRAAHKSNDLIISVVDQGIGIPFELQPQIFDKFVGLHLPYAPRGYGLGLAFCKLAVEAHGGQITLESALDQGSTFSLSLPVRGPERLGH